jgi:hypothetical protein
MGPAHSVTPAFLPFMKTTFAVSSHSGVLVNQSCTSLIHPALHSAVANTLRWSSVVLSALLAHLCMTTTSLCSVLLVSLVGCSVLLLLPAAVMQRNPSPLFSWLWPFAEELITPCVGCYGECVYRRLHLETLLYRLHPFFLHSPFLCTGTFFLPCCTAVATAP